MATTQFVIANNVNTQLAAAASSSATTLTLASSANLPTLSAGQVMPLTLNDAATGQNYEIVYVTAITGVTLTVTRAQEGTGALTWNVGDYAFCPPTAGTVATALGNPSNTFQVAPATASQHAAQFGQVNTGRLLNVQVITSSGTYTPTAGTNSIIVEIIGGGGGSGGVAAPGTGSGAISKAGQSGAYAKVRFTTGFSGAAVTIGAAGTAGASGANAGGTGGTTSFGSLISCPGGSGSPAGTINAGYVFLPSIFGAAAPTITSGTTLASLAPTVGSVNVAAASGGVGVAGSGANTPLGVGGIGATQGPGNSGTGYGVGAGGAYAGSGSAAQTGAAGTPGVVIVYEYA